MTEKHTNKLARLQAAGWKVGNVQDFLQLSEEETRLVELKYFCCTQGDVLSFIENCKYKRLLMLAKTAER
jgi:hypothetical protein